MAKYLDSNGLLYFWGKCKAKFLENVAWDPTNRKLTKTKNGDTTDLVTFSAVATSGSYTDLTNQPTIPSVPSASTATPAMDGTASAGTSDSWSRGDHVHPTDTSRAASSHAHGSITNAGAITTNTALASGDRLVFSDSSDSSKLKRSTISFGSSTTTYLRNDGTWGTPTGSAGGLEYQGTATSNSDLGTSYKAGYYWIVGSAGGTIAGQTVEAGDMVLAHADYSGTIVNDVDIVQSNVERITDSDIDTIVAA